MSIAMRSGVRLLLTGLLCLPCPGALALNPALDVNQYAHAAWRAQEGFSKGGVRAIAQTPDGFLWLGTDLGLLRFDGLRTTRWQPPPGESLSDARIRVLFVARDGALWIGGLRGLATWNHGRLVTYPQFEQWTPNGLIEDREGTIWLGAESPTTDTGLLCAIRGGETQCYGKDGSFGQFVTGVLEDRRGNLWVTSANGLWRWRPGQPQRYPLPDRVLGLKQTMSETPAGEILVATEHGVRELIEGRIKEYWIPPAPLGRTLIFSDRDEGLWIANAERGLVHQHDGRIDEFGRADGLSGDEARAFLEDREGNVWVATTGGLDRFHALAATTYSAGQGVVGFVGSVLADKDGSIWFSTSAGLYNWNGAAHFKVYRSPHKPALKASSWTSAPSVPMVELATRGLPESPVGSLFQDRRGRVWLGTESALGYLDHDRFVSVIDLPAGYIDSMAEDRDGNLWIAHRAAGLLELSSDHVVQRIPWTTISGRGRAWRLAVDAERRGLWLGFYSGGVAHFVDGQVIATYDSGDGLGKGPVYDIRAAADGTVWIATDGGLSRLTDSYLATLTTKEGLPCDQVDWSIEREDSTWAYTACGLVRIAASDLQSWAAGLNKTKSGASGVRMAILDNSDGVAGFWRISSFSPHIAETADGGLWLVSLDGLTSIDPHHLPFNKLPPPVYVEQIVADRRLYQASRSLELPSGVRDLEITYTALSLVAPERVQFRYMLEGHDREWRDAADRRSAFYTDLSPGTYRFRVIASNNSGVWNTQGATIDFSVAPAYWQTNWFRALCVLAFVALVWLAYQLRLRQLTQAFNMTLEARVSERTRVARELHDTLLQSFQGLLLRFQTVAELLPSRPADARRTMLSAVDQAAKAIRDGRDAVQGLRASAVESADLADQLRTVGELAASESGKDAVGFLVEVEGTLRALKPIVRDEIYRIAGEALRNAFRHAQAKRIEVELRYDPRQLRLRVRDDGKGVDPRVMQEGSEGAISGHHGLRGMRERAGLIGGTVTIWSALKSGTEVELVVPASRAYARTRPARGSWILDRIARKRAQRVS